jgi:hypothetical protein
MGLTMVLGLSLARPSEEWDAAARLRASFRTSSDLFDKGLDLLVGDEPSALQLGAFQESTSKPFPNGPFTVMEHLCNFWNRVKFHVLSFEQMYCFRFAISLDELELAISGRISKLLVS